MKKCKGIVIYTDEPMSAIRKEMLGIFFSNINDMDQKFKVEYVTLIEVSSMKSEIVMHTIEKTLIERGIDFTKIRFCSLDGTNLVSGKYKCLENM